MISIVHNTDCLQELRNTPDNAYDLAVVDPPYGIQADSNAYKNGQNCKINGFKEHQPGSWDSIPPPPEYFAELFRVSKQQVIWGGNYFDLPATSCYLVWNKVQRGFSFADGELAWTSFSSAVRIFDYARGNDSGFAPKLKGVGRIGINIHPTQKPVALYKWVYQLYAKPGYRILDTHVGSGSSRLAAHDAGLDYIGYEIDKHYYAAQEKRYREYIQQASLFDAAEITVFSNQ